MRCTAQTVTTITAVASWAASVAILTDNPQPGEPLRLVYFAMLAVAAVTTALALGTAMFHWIVRGHDELRDARWVYEVGYRHGLVDGARKAEEQRPRHPLRLVND